MTLHFFYSCRFWVSSGSELDLQVFRYIRYHAKILILQHSFSTQFPSILFKLESVTFMFIYVSQRYQNHQFIDQHLYMRHMKYCSIFFPLFGKCR